MNKNSNSLFCSILFGFMTLFLTEKAFAASANETKSPAFSVTLRVVSDNQPVAFASVYFPKLKLSGTTDSLGEAVIEGVSEGKHLVEISFIGYEKQSQVLDISSKNKFFVVELKSNQSLLDEVVVTGSMKEMRKSESVVPVEMFSPKYFERNPTPSLFEAMSSVNGVRPQLQCSVCNTGDIHINGMEGPYTMILIDNMPIVSGLSTVYGLSGIPNSIVQRIEIVKGPAAALYGSEAMGGIINVITKSPKSAPKLSIDLNATSYQEFNADVATGFSLGKKAHSVLGLNYFHFDKRFDINNDNFTDVTLSKRLSVFNKWSFDRPDNRVADVAFRYVNENRFGGELQWTPEFRGGDSIYGESIYTKRYEFLANYQLPIKGEKVLFNVSANRHIQDSYYGTTKYFADQNIVFGQLVWDKKINKIHDLLVGVGHRYTYYDDNTPVTADKSNTENKPQEKTLTGGFVQDEISPNAQWKIIVGARYDYSNVHGNILSPRLGAKYKINNTDNLRLNVGNGFRVVNVFSEDHAALIGGRNVVFVNELKPEKSWNGNLNYTRLQTFPNGFVNIDASAFYTYYNNKIIADYLTDPEKVIYDNLKGFADNYGVSLNTDWTIGDRFKSTIGGTFLQSYIHENGTKREQIQTPHFTTNYSFSYTLPQSHISFDFNGYVNSPMLLPTFDNDYRPIRSPFFNISNVQITKTWLNGLEIYGGVKNVFNFVPKEDVILRAFDPFDKRLDINNPNNYTFDPSYNYAPIQQARLFVGVRMKIK
jgi:outer membrane receptor for ferrienterochelin and colicins